MDLSNKTYIGIVEDNNDPKKIGRCRIRVIDIFDDIPTEDIPWATPQKDLNGNQFILPDVGKVVSVIFDNGNIYTPEYRYAQRYNINLEDKLKALSETGYRSMRSVIFDHKTQVYSNDDEGLILDYKMNKINVDANSIHLELKGDGGSVNIGSKTATQPAILGDNFLNWFDEFVDELLGSNGGPYLGNLTAPVIPSPTLISTLVKYKALKDPKFLSRNVYLNDNYQVDELSRPAKGQLGDKWTSTVKENEFTSSENSDFRDRGKEAPLGQLTTSSSPNSFTNITSDSDIEAQEPPEGEVNPDIEVLLEVLRHKKYTIYERPFEINTIGVRYQYQGQEYSDKFKDRLYALWKDNSGKWKVKYWSISTIPGKVPGKSDRNKYSLLKDAVGRTRGGLGIMKPAQYINVYKMGYHKDQKPEARAMKTVGKQLAYRDQNYGDKRITFSNEDPNNSKGGANFGMHIHKAYSTGAGKNTYGVQNWSEGCQVFGCPNSLNQYFDLCEKHKELYGNQFTYTLITSKDVDEAQKRVNR